MIEVMFDLETLGTRPGCIVLSIGAVAFERNTEDEIRDHFHRTIDVDDSERLGLRCEAQTAIWWAKQHKETLEATTIQCRSAAYVAGQFKSFCERVDAELFWCNGQDFDFPIWEAVCRAVDMSPPWKYNAKRDLRTVGDILGFDLKSLPRVGTEHDALDDAYNQTIALLTALKARGSQG